MTTILVGPAALASTAPFVQHRTDDLAAFLKMARVKETTQ
jgi:putative hydrolase of the HAD superfamily